MEAVISEREANGPYKDIYDLVERVNLSACNRSAIESLALSGALDCFGERREMYLADCNGTSYSDVLVKYGQRFQVDKNSCQGSLFGDLEPIETAHPPKPEFEPWSDLRILEEEKKMVTMYLSAHPLDPYYMELTYGVTTPCKEVRMQETAGETITFGGLVTGFEVRTSAKGKPYGVLRIEDFTGATEQRLFGTNFQKMQAYAVPGTAIIVKATVAENPYRPGNFDLNINNVGYLADTAHTANAISIELEGSSAVEDLRMVLTKFTEDSERPGTLYLNIRIPETGQTLHLKSNRKVAITRQLVNELKALGVEFRILSE